MTLLRLLRAKPVDRFPDADRVLDGWVPTTPALDLFAMIVSLSHGQAELAGAIVRLARMQVLLAVLWAVLSVLWSWQSVGKLTGWW
jgi:hypothetical protein